VFVIETQVRSFVQLAQTSCDLTSHWLHHFNKFHRKLRRSRSMAKTSECSIRKPSHTFNVDVIHSHSRRPELKMFYFGQVVEFARLFYGRLISVNYSQFFIFKRFGKSIDLGKLENIFHIPALVFKKRLNCLFVLNRTFMVFFCCIGMCHWKWYRS
jgi:hypothetical protein